VLLSRAVEDLDLILSHPDSQKQGSRDAQLRDRRERQQVLSHHSCFWCRSLWSRVALWFSRGVVGSCWVL